MLELKDLIQILSVSRSWAAAVRSMKPINAKIQRSEPAHEVNGFCSVASIRRIVVSPLFCSPLYSCVHGVKPVAWSFDVCGWR